MTRLDHELYASPFTGMDRFIDRALSGAGRIPLWFPAVSELSGAGFALDLYEDADAHYIVAELPGFSKDSVSLELEDRTLSITAERKTGSGETEQTARGVRRLEVPEGIDSNAIEARMENGLLRVRLPKVEERKPRAISVN